MTKAELVAAYSDWLSRYNWCWFATLTFRGYPPLSKAHRCFRRWITEIEKQDGDPDFRWVRVTERGAYGANIHFHVLVGGLRCGSKFPWILRWEQLAGHAWITYFVRCRGGAGYVVKTACPGRDFEIDFKLTPDLIK